MSERSQAGKKYSIGHSIKMVAWSFLGIRRNSGFQDDMAKVSPFHVIAVGIAGAFIFVVGLIVLVNWVVAK
jgi:hypothetical protein